MARPALPRGLHTAPPRMGRRGGAVLVNISICPAPPRI
ncbi:hypothetical protein CCACVL1_05229 [Corchorus capsularis]|uniref:Uncharacterized protein n=1 Tax=Corchorus capsularis TaxID=210143 RepID=A0A1R3JM77_COCAP|nr:hypothetical protein CCACVL1_05229 [Corchorus capsularis]